MSGTVYGIGVGPGDPELITLKGARLLSACPVIAYPAPETGDSLARRIAAPHIPGDATEIIIRTPMSTDRFPAEEVYDRAALTIGEHLAAGRDVAVLCEGDPFFYGSFMYLFARLAEQWPVEVVPGVSSLMACAATLGAPLAARNDVLTVLPAPLDDAILSDRLAGCDAAAIIKVGRHFGRVRALLNTLGLAEHARYMHRVNHHFGAALGLDVENDAGVGVVGVGGTDLGLGDRTLAHGRGSSRTRECHEGMLPLLGHQPSVRLPPSTRGHELCVRVGGKIGHVAQRGSHLLLRRPLPRAGRRLVGCAPQQRHDEDGAAPHTVAVERQRVILQELGVVLGGLAHDRL